MAASEDAELVAAADALYALPAEEFTAARNAEVKRVRTAGDRDLAAAIQRLARPSAAAALANRLVRRDAAAFEPLLELGVALRQATAALDGAQLRTLSRQQQQVVTALVRLAREVAKEDGLKVSEGTLRELDDTLRAAIADAGAAEQLMAGRLTGPLQHSGFGPTPSGHLTVVPDRPARSAAKAAAKSEPAADRATQANETRRARAAEAVATAEAALEAAVTARQSAAARVTELETSATELRARVEHLRADLAAAQTEHARAERDQTKAKDALTKASQGMRAAARRLDDATARLEQLD